MKSFSDKHTDLGRKSSFRQDAETSTLQACAPQNFRWDSGRDSRLVDEKAAHSLKHLVEFLDRHFSNRVKDDVLFDGEKPLRTNETGLIDLAALTIGTIQWNGERIPVRAAGDLAQN